MRWPRFMTALVEGLRGEAPSLPPMDGPYKPNRLLDEATALLERTGADNLAHWQGRPVFAAGPQVCGLDGAVRLTLPADVTALAGDGADRLVAALAGGGLIDLRGGAQTPLALPGSGDITAVALAGDGAILATRGAEARGLGDWQRALLERDRSGSLWRLDARGAARLLGGLAWPAGVIDSAGGPLVAEANLFRLIGISGARSVPVVDDLPGFPARLISDGAQGHVLTLMAPRNQLLEFVMGETAYLRRMLDEVPPAAWIAPMLAPPDSYLQPMQQGAQRAHGVLKPWSPVFSQGMVLRLDREFRPVALAMSRADGRRHGIRSLCLHDGKLLVTSCASHEILCLNLPGANP